MAMPRSFGGRFVISVSPSRIFPPSGLSRPAMSASVVLLPQPDGPSKVKKVPAGISRSKPSTALTSP